MPGTLYLGCGSAADEAPLWLSIFHRPITRMVYYGGSAGAVLACDSIEIADGHDPNEPGLEDFMALGLISGVAVLPHFTDDQLDGARRWAASRHTVVLGLPESAGLRCSGDKITVIGGRQLTRVSEHVVERFASGTTLTLEVP